MLWSIVTCAYGPYSIAGLPTLLRLTVLLTMRRTSLAYSADAGPRLSCTVVLYNDSDGARTAEPKSAYPFVSVRFRSETTYRRR